MRAYRRKYRKTKMWVFRSIYNATLKQSLNGWTVFECHCAHTFTFCSGWRHVRTFEIYIYVNKHMQQLMKLGILKILLIACLFLILWGFWITQNSIHFPTMYLHGLQFFNHQRKVYGSQQRRSSPGNYSPNTGETLGWMRLDVLDLNEIKWNLTSKCKSSLQSRIKAHAYSLKNVICWRS